MASGGADIEANLKTYLDRSAKDTMMTLSQAKKCFVQAKLDKKYAPVLESSVWGVHQNAAKKIDTKVVATKILEETAKCYVTRKHNLKTKADMENKEVVDALEEIRAALSKPTAACAKVTVKNSDAVDRLTDTSKYTGAHKSRFGADGTGMGIAGREDVVANDGYVGNYKGKDTYRTKK